MPSPANTTWRGVSYGEQAMSDYQSGCGERPAAARKTSGTFALWLLLLLVIAGAAVALGTGVLRLSEPAMAFIGLKPTKDLDRFENLLLSARQTDDALAQIRQNVTLTQSLLEKTNRELRENVVAFGAAQDSAAMIDAALQKARAARENGDFRDAAFYSSHALLRDPGSTALLFGYADDLEAVIVQCINTAQISEAFEIFNQLEMALNNSLYAISPDRVESVRERLRRIDALRERILILDAGMGDSFSPAITTALDAMDSGREPSWRFAVAADENPTAESVSLALEEREAVYAAAARAGKPLVQGRYADLELEIKKYHALLSAFEAESDFNRCWQQAEDIDNGNPGIAAFMLQGAETALRRRIELRYLLPEKQRKTIDNDLTRLQERSEMLAINTVTQAQESNYLKAKNTAEARLGDAKKWKSPTIANISIGESLDKNWDKFIAELNSYDRGKRGACQRQIEKLAKDIADVETLSNGVTLPRFRVELEQCVSGLNQEILRVRQSQMNLYSQWAAGRISATWRYGISFVGYVWDNEKSWADALVRGMGDIDTQLLSRDAHLLFNTVHDKLFSHMEDASKASHENQEKYKLNLVHRFLDTRKIQLDAF